MNNIYNNVAIRSLNQVKTLNPIAYLALRCFFDSFKDKKTFEKFGLMEKIGS